MVRSPHVEGKKLPSTNAMPGTKPWAPRLELFDTDIPAPVILRRLPDKVDDCLSFLTSARDLLYCQSPETQLQRFWETLWILDRSPIEESMCALSEPPTLATKPPLIHFSLICAGALFQNISSVEGDLTAYHKAPACIFHRRCRSC